MTVCAEADAVAKPEGLCSFVFSLWLHILLQPVLNYLPGVDAGKIWRIPHLGGTEDIRGHAPQCTFQLGSRRQGLFLKSYRGMGTVNGYLWKWGSCHTVNM